jgi:hypothetical protein
VALAAGIKRINISSVLAGQKHGIKEVDDGTWMTALGSRVSCTMILDISARSRKPCNPSTTF